MLQIRDYTFNHGHMLDLSPHLRDKTSNISHDPLLPGAWFGTGLGRGEEAEDDQGKGRGGKRDLAGASQHHGQGPAAPLTPASPRPALKSVPVPASPEGVCWAPGAKARGLAWDKACRCQTWSSVQRRE